MDAHGRLQVIQVVFLTIFVPYGLAMVADFRGLASRTLDRLRGQGVAGRLYARMPVWFMRASGIWMVAFAVGQFFLIR